MPTVHQPDPTTPPGHRWNMNKLEDGGDPDEGTAWAVYEIDADSRPQAELRAITVVTYDYEDDFRGSVFTAHPDPGGTPGRHRVLFQLARPGGRGAPESMEPEARYALYGGTGPGPQDVLDAPTVHPHIHLRIIDVAAHARQLYGKAELAVILHQRGGEPLLEHEYRFEVTGPVVGRLTCAPDATAADIVAAVQREIDLRKEGL